MSAEHEALSVDSVVVHMRDYWSVEKYDRLAELRAQIAEADKELRQFLNENVWLHLLTVAEARRGALSFMKDAYPDLPGWRLEVYPARIKGTDHVKLKPAF